MSILDDLRYLAEKDNYLSDGRLMTPNFSRVEVWEYVEKIINKKENDLSETRLFIEVIEQEIKWHEERPVHEVNENYRIGFLAGLRHLLNLASKQSKIKHELTQRFPDAIYCADCGDEIIPLCPECSGEE